MKRLFSSLVIAAILSFGIAWGASLVPFEIMDDVLGFRNTLTIKASLYVNRMDLVANTAQTETIPTGAMYVNMNCTGQYYVNFTGTATVPAGNITNGTGSALSVGARYIGGLTSFSVISPVACTITFEYYSSHN